MSKTVQIKGRAEKLIEAGLSVVYIITVLIITLWTRRYDDETHVVMNPFHAYITMFRSFAQSQGWDDFVRRVGWYRGYMSSIGLNILLFVPLGFLIPSVSRSFTQEIEWTWRKALLLGLTTSLVIEGLQLFTHHGWFDTSDLLHNTVGCVIGYGLYRSFLRS
jgi:glycopeptide antibiotics resistance protein